MWLGPGNTPGGRCEVQRRDNNERVDERWRRQMVGKGCHLPGGSRPKSALFWERSQRPQKSRAVGWRGRWAGGECRSYLVLLNCTLRHTWEPLVHPKYTPAKKVTKETMVSSEASHIQTQWRGTALPRPFPMSIHPAAALLEKRAAPAPEEPGLGRWAPSGDRASLAAGLPGVAQVAEHSTNRS